MSDSFHIIIDNLKSSNSCINFLRSRGLKVRSSNDCICAPDFIRPDHHPSFQVSDSFCFDHTYHKSYSIIDLVMLADHISFADACTKLNHGVNPFIREHLNPSPDFQNAQAKLNDLIISWHSQLLSNPQALDYLHSRRISDNTINTFMLGYNPDTQRLIFPYAKNNLFCYYNGRDLSGRCETSPKSFPKYKKCSLSSSIAAEHIFWGNQTLNPRKKTPITYTGADGQEYDTGRFDPRDGTLCVLEGMVDALSFAQDGWQVQASGGGLPRKLETLLIQKAKMYQRVFLCFDNDNAGSHFQKSAARLMLTHGINFICGQVPHEFNGMQIKDVSDYYCAGGDLAELVSNATPGLLACADAAANPDELAEVFSYASRFYPREKIFELKEHCYSLFNPRTGEPYGKKAVNFLFMEACKALAEPEVAKLVSKDHNLLYDVSGAFYEYSLGAWRPVNDLIVQSYIARVLGINASSTRMKAVCHFLKASYAGSYPFNRKPVFVFKNGTLCLDVSDPQMRFRPSMPEDMSVSQVNYNYEPHALCRVWEGFLDKAMKGDLSKIRLLQEMAGYVLFTDCRMQKMFYFIGDGRNGKSLFLNILRQVFGPDNCVSLQPSNFGSKFDPIVLKDAMLNLCFEAGSLLRNEDAVKAVASGDPILAAHKGVDAVTFTSRAKVFVAANRLPQGSDASWGLLRKMLFVKWDNVITDSEDNKNLYDELLEELPGIFNWCYAGYLRLKNRGEFTKSDDVEAAMEQFKEQLTPSMIFAREELTDHEEGVFDEKQIYAEARAWAADGCFALPNRKVFIEEVRQIIRQEKREERCRPAEKRRYDLVSVSRRAGSPLWQFTFGDEDEGLDSGMPVIALPGRGGYGSDAGRAEAGADVEGISSVACGEPEEDDPGQVQAQEHGRQSQKPEAVLPEPRREIQAEGESVDDEAEERTDQRAQEKEVERETAADSAGAADVAEMVAGIDDSELSSSQDKYASLIDMAENISEAHSASESYEWTIDPDAHSPSWYKEDYAEWAFSKLRSFTEDGTSALIYTSDSGYWRMIREYVRHYPSAKAEIPGLDEAFKKYLPEGFDAHEQYDLPLDR